MPDIRAPGSDAAIDAGCLCPIIDNAQGWGNVFEGQYVYDSDCPLHGLGRLPLDNDEDAEAYDRARTQAWEDEVRDER